MTLLTYHDIVDRIHTLRHCLGSHLSPHRRSSSGLYINPLFIHTIPRLAHVHLHFLWRLSRSPHPPLRSPSRATHSSISRRPKPRIQIVGLLRSRTRSRCRSVVVCMVYSSTRGDPLVL